jgi:hypothetical protein
MTQEPWSDASYINGTWRHNTAAARGHRNSAMSGDRHRDEVSRPPQQTGKEAQAKPHLDTLARRLLRRRLAALCSCAFRTLRRNEGMRTRQQKVPANTAATGLGTQQLPQPSGHSQAAHARDRTQRSQRQMATQRVAMSKTRSEPDTTPQVRAVPAASAAACFAAGSLRGLGDRAARQNRSGTCVSESERRANSVIAWLGASERSRSDRGNRGDASRQAKQQTAGGKGQQRSGS